MQVDVENIDRERFPLAENANYVECVLKAGELLYIPVSEPCPSVYCKLLLFNFYALDFQCSQNGGIMCARWKRVSVSASGFNEERDTLWE